jgi:hypothetical protein
MPTTTTPAPTAPRATRRTTLDLALDDHRRLRQWCLDANLDASLLLRALIGLADADPGIRVRAEGAAADLLRARRGVER